MRADPEAASGESSHGHPPGDDPDVAATPG
jgi:hypothetical protein